MHPAYLPAYMPIYQVPAYLAQLQRTFLKYPCTYSSTPGYTTRLVPSMLRRIVVRTRPLHSPSLRLPLRLWLRTVVSGLLHLTSATRPDMPQGDVGTSGWSGF